MKLIQQLIAQIMFTVTMQVLLTKWSKLIMKSDKLSNKNKWKKVCQLISVNINQKKSEIIQITKMNRDHKQLI